MPWSNPIRLVYYDYVPNESGIYEIGTYLSGTFKPMYVGRTEVSIKNRLRAHYNRRGNSDVAARIENSKRDNLYCRWMRTCIPVDREANLLRRHGCGEGTRYEWNKRM